MAARYWDRELKEWVWAELIETARNVSLGDDTGDVVWGRAGEWEVERENGSRMVYGARTFEGRCRLEAPNYVEQIDLNNPVTVEIATTSNLPGLKEALETYMDRNSILREVYRERVRQDERWGVQNHVPAYWLAILAEEVGEVAQEIAQSIEPENNLLDVDWSNYRTELIQVAAVAIQAVESLDRGRSQHGTQQPPADTGDSETAAGTSPLWAGGGVSGMSGTVPLHDAEDH